MKDLTDLFERLSRSDVAWGRESAATVALYAIATHRGLNTDWDPRAGETWIRLLDGGSVVLLVSTTAPIAFSLAPTALLLDGLDVPVEIVSVESMHSAHLFASPATVASLFPQVQPDLPNPYVFSVLDLWYDTV